MSTSLNINHPGKTTDIESLREGARYTWGEIRRIHDVGAKGPTNQFYTVIEYVPRFSNSEELDLDVTLFSCYLNGVNLNTGAATFEGALLLCIGAAHLDKNAYTHMALGASKLLGLKEAL